MQKKNGHSTRMEMEWERSRKQCFWRFFWHLQYWYAPSRRRQRRQAAHRKRFLARLHPAPKRKRRKRSWEDGWLPMERSIITTPKGRNSKTPFGKFRESFIILTKTAAWNGMHLSGKTETFIMRMPKAHLPPDGKRSTKSSFILASGDGQCPALRPSTENSIIFPSAEKC